MIYPNLGPDKRPLGAWGGKVQAALSFRDSRPYALELPLFLGDWFQLLLAFTPRRRWWVGRVPIPYWLPFLSVFVRWPKSGPKRWASLRLFWRRDKYWGDKTPCGNCQPCVDERPWACETPTMNPPPHGGFLADVILKLWFDRIVHY